MTDKLYSNHEPTTSSISREAEAWKHEASLVYSLIEVLLEHGTVRYQGNKSCSAGELCI